MEKNEQVFEQAMANYNDVAKANLLAQELDVLHNKIRLESKKNPLVIFSRDFKLPVIGTDNIEHPSIKVLINKAEISYNTYYKSDCMFSCFYLSLHLIAYNGNFMFDIANSKDGYEDFKVFYKKDKFELQCGDGAFVTFKSMEDLQLILDFCNKAIAMFNEKAPENYKLINHF